MIGFQGETMFTISFRENQSAPWRSELTAIGFVLLFFLVQVCFGQAFQAQVTGVVHDSSGAVVPDAQLILKSAATGARLTAVSNSDGIYRFPALPPASYELSCTLVGFKAFHQGPFDLQVNQVYDLEIIMQPGQTSEEITVTAAPPPLETSSATVGQVVTQRSIENLPLNGRDPLALIALTPGVTLGSTFAANGNGSGNDVGRNFFRSDFNVGGGRSGSQEILLDGVSNTTADINRGIINPPVDSVQEFKVQANSYDAEFGRTSGGVVNIITRGGTNALHGLIYDFERHSIWDANNFFNNRAGRPKLSFQRHQFGTNLGGPILKNKWFFFGDYEGMRQAFPQTAVSTVPTDRQKAGDFSQTLASNGSLITIYDPLNLITLPNGTKQRVPFVGNLIPSTRIDPVAAKLAAMIPGPNTAGAAITGQNNYVYTANSILNSDKWDIRSDVNFTGNTRMFFRYSRQDDVRILPGNLPLPVGGGLSVSDVYNQAMIDLTHVLSGSTVADLQFAFSRALASQLGLTEGFDLTGLGLPPVYTSQLQNHQIPIITISDTTGIAGGGDVYQYQPRNSFVTRGSVNHLQGRHALKFGGESRILDFNEGQNAIPSGSFNVTRQFTQGPNPNQTSTNGGFGFASFLLGTAASGTQRQINPTSTQGFYYATFVQDDWRITGNLTINLGLRWDVGIGNREKYNRLAWFDPTASSPLAGPAGLPNLTGLLRWVGKENDSDQQKTQWKNFGPRVGFAYSPTSRMVVRGGYGLIYIPKSIQGLNNGAIEAFRDTSMVTSIDGITPANYLSNPFPTGVLPAANDRDPLANTGNSINAPTHDFRSGYSQIWSLGVQRELPWGFTMDAHYWGNRGTGLLLNWNINQLPDQYLSLGSKLNDVVPNPFSGLVTAGVLAGKTISRQQSLLPFPQYTAVTQVFVPNGNSIYHAGTLQVERRLSTRFTLQAAYTRSKSIDDVRTPLDFYNRRAERALSAFDAPNQFVMSGVSRLPFGRGQAIGAHVNRVVDLFIGGWDLDGILRIQSGFPIAISRPSLSNGQSASLASRNIDHWFNTGDFTVASAFTFGNIGPVLPDVRGDGIRNVDAVVVKNLAFTVREHLITAQFRAEAYNLFNRAQFSAPNGTVSSQSFGTVTAQANNPRDIQLGLKFKF